MKTTTAPDDGECHELSAPEPMSRRTWDDIDEAIRNLDRGEVGDVFDLDELEELFKKP